MYKYAAVYRVVMRFFFCSIGLINFALFHVNIFFSFFSYYRLRLSVISLLSKNKKNTCCCCCAYITYIIYIFLRRLYFQEGNCESLPNYVGRTNAAGIDLNRDFRGLVYAKDFPLECSARGNAHQNVTLRLPTSGCGVRAEPRADGVMELSVRVMLQMEQKLRQSSDILRTVRCKLPPTAMGMMVGPIAGMVNKRARIKAGQEWKVASNYR